MKFTKFTILGAALFVAACDTPSSPNKIIVDVDRSDTVITGTYFQSGFSQTEVRKLLGKICKTGRVASFDVKSRGEMNQVTATCATGTPFGEFLGVAFERIAPGTVQYWATYSQNGTRIQETFKVNI